MKKNIYILFIAAIILSISCDNDNDNRNTEEFKFPDIEFIIGLASPVNLSTDSTIVFIKDYVPQDVEIENINTHEAIQHQLSEDSLTIKLKIISDDLPKLSILKLNLAGIEHSILLKRSRKLKQKIRFDPKGKKYTSIQMKGEMNAWNPANTPLTETDSTGIWEAEFEAEPGTYQYVFVVDGREMPDPDNPQKVSNGMGNFNSIMSLGNIDESQNPIIYTDSSGNNVINISYDNKVSKLIVLYKNFELDEGFINIKENIFQIIIPADAKDQDRTHIRIWAYNDHGISNDLLIPIHKGQVLTDVSKLMRTDFHSAVLYNTFIDRFADGNPENNRPTKDRSILPKANFYGGDIGGITKKIEEGYFKDLGINTLWISPIVKNAEGAWGQFLNPNTKFSAYHGYWPVSFTVIDDRFGTEEEFKKLVKTAHEHDMNVLLDFIANHVHLDHPIYKEHKDWATNLYLPDGSLNTEKWDDHRLTTWFDVHLPSLDLTKPEVYNMLSDSAVYWIKNYDLDGFRHDATKHIPEIFWQTLTQKIKEQIIIPQKRNIYQIGETYGTPELISSYVNTGQLDAQFDFNIYDALTGVLANKGSFENFARVLKTSQKYYGSNHLMGNITGNQDRARFISYASGSLSFNEDAKSAGWNRVVGVEDSAAYKKCAILNAIVSTIPGLPVIFYGDEIGMPGGNDPDNRKMMRFNDLIPKEKELKEITKSLLHFRKNSMALMYGDLHIIEATQDLLIYSRSYFNETVIVAVNNSNKEKTITFNAKVKNNDTFKTKFNSEFNKESNLFEINLKANSFDILSNSKK